MSRDVEACLVLFATGTQGKLDYIRQQSPGGDWRTWKEIAEKCSQVSVGMNADGSLEVFGVGPGEVLHYLRETAPGGEFGKQSELSDRNGRTVVSKSVSVGRGRGQKAACIQR